MIEAIQVATIDVAKTAPAAAQSSPAQANSFDVRAFEAAMNSPGGIAPLQTAVAPPPVASTEPTGGTRMLLTAIDNLNGGAENINVISQTMSDNVADLTPGQMMQMTMKCHQFLFQCELTSNVANRTSDGIQQLFRQQS